MSTNNLRINNNIIGPGNPTYIIAELSCNHNQNYENAIKLVHAAKEVGANAIKLQTYTPDTITLDCDNDYFKIKSGTLWDGLTLYELYSKAYTPWKWHEGIKNEAEKIGLDFFSSPFDVTAVEFLEKMNVPAYKVASFEVSDHILLKKIANTGKPVIISTGATELAEISEAVNLLKSNGTKDICILKCTSAYPAPIKDANLKTIQNIIETFNCISGLSDHTSGIEIPIAAVCLGASIIEKHFTLDKNSGSPDDKFSLEPYEFKQMVDSIRKIEKAIGRVKYNKSSTEKNNFIFKRSLFAVKDIMKGESFTNDNIKSIRPSHGLHTKYYNDILGKIASKNIERGTPMSWDLMHKMKILFLGSDDYQKPLILYLRKEHDVTVCSNKITPEFCKHFDFIISYGYRYIIKKEIIDLFPKKIINLHISLLPWNKGSDPNLWSFIDDTPKGVTIHYIDEGLDTGKIICQKEIQFNDQNYTLRDTYNILQTTIQQLLIENWDNVKTVNIDSFTQTKLGTNHLTKDKYPWFNTLEKGWDTPVSDIKKLYDNSNI